MDSPGSAAGPAERRCDWHLDTSTTARLVRVSATTTNSRGANLYACADCRAKHHLTPIDDLTPADLYNRLAEASAFLLGRS